LRPIRASSAVAVSGAVATGIGGPTALRAPAPVRHSCRCRCVAFCDEASRARARFEYKFRKGASLNKINRIWDFIQTILPLFCMVR
jgi:hypothetical protein